MGLRGIEQFQSLIEERIGGSKIAVLMMDLLHDLWAFMKAERKFWLAPAIIALLVVGVLVILAQFSAVAPFIYTLF